MNIPIASYWALRLHRIVWGIVVVASCLTDRVVVGQDTTEILVASMRHANSIQSYEFRVTEASSGIDGVSPPSVKEVIFRQSGDMFRTDLMPNGSAVAAMISAYNGTRYQLFTEKASTLSYSNTNRFPNPYMAINPLLMPYVWMMSRPGWDWSDLKSPEIWIEASRRGRLLGRETVRSLDCAVMTLPYAMEPASSVTVYFAIDLDCYPIRVVGSGQQNGRQFDLNVMEYIALRTDNRDVIIPTLMIATESGPRVQRKEWRIVPDTVKINQTVPEELFTLSPGMAKVVDDYDRNMDRRFKQGYLRGLKDEKPTRYGQFRRKWILMANVIVVFCGISYFVFQRMRARHLN